MTTPLIGKTSQTTVERAQKLEGDALTTALATVPGWTVQDGHLARDFAITRYRSGVIPFAGDVMAIADVQRHHPDMTVSWGKVRVAVCTHDVGGLSNLDFAFATAVDAAFSKVSVKREPVTIDAFYTPLAVEPFGSGASTWQLLSDGDVSAHMTGHAYLDRQAPSLKSERTMILTGMLRDFTSALLCQSPHVPEDFSRTWAESEITLRDAPQAAFGVVFGGFAWRVTEALAGRVGGLENACRAMMGVAYATIDNITAEVPTAKDMVDAFARAIRQLQPQHADALLATLKQEGVNRNLIDSTWSEPRV